MHFFRLNFCMQGWGSGWFCLDPDPTHEKKTLIRLRTTKKTRSDPRLNRILITLKFSLIEFNLIYRHESTYDWSINTAGKVQFQRDFRPDPDSTNFLKPDPDLYAQCTQSHKIRHIFLLKNHFISLHHISNDKYHVSKKQ